MLMYLFRRLIEAQVWKHTQGQCSCCQIEFAKTQTSLYTSAARLVKCLEGQGCLILLTSCQDTSCFPLKTLVYLISP
jgi:hypothetical protein